MKFNSLFAALACLSFYGAPPAASACPPVALSAHSPAGIAAVIVQPAVEAQFAAVSVVQPSFLVFPAPLVVQAAPSVIAVETVRFSSFRGVASCGARVRVRALGQARAGLFLNGGRQRTFSRTVVRSFSF